ncbi:MAG: RDD family protein [Chitinophagales bacterium]|nr:RDD family protein [Bacteroidota bacterium]MBP7400857.1 RDD family protein [Chitinophagales bacterium]MBK8487517.1 RDD family protein [Bacteroidota bacterium]MBK8682737.1 RDD family protein [Bacteroidota bacterium]MBP8753920.1 RDD family protein [Chitinophagales bacterium]
MQIIDSQSGQTIYAGFLSRFVAYIIDMLMIGIARSILALIFGFSLFHPSMGIIWFGSIFGLLYFIIMEGSKYQATVGKLLMRIKVVNLQGGRITLSESIIRNLSKILSAIFLLIGFLMVLLDDRKRALHDRIAGTFVIEE